MEKKNYIAEVLTSIGGAAVIGIFIFVLSSSQRISTLEEEKDNIESRLDSIETTLKENNNLLHEIKGSLNK